MKGESIGQSTAVSKKTVLLLLLSILFISVAVRYPLVEHERNQSDSYFIHSLSESISSNGYAMWTFHPLSYVGYFPFSYPSGVPFLISEISSLTGLNLESTILLTGFMLSIMFALAVFGLARQFVMRPQYVLLATLLASLAPRFVDTTYWDGSARGPIVVLIILVVFVSFRAGVTGQKKLHVFTLLFVLGSFATHHMAVLLMVLALGYLMSAFLTYFALRKVQGYRRSVLAASTLLVVLVGGLVVLSTMEYLSSLGFSLFIESGFLEIDHPLLSLTVNMAVSYTHQIGLVLVFAFLSIPLMFRGPFSRVESLFLVALPIAFVPLLGSSFYVSMVLTPFIAILGIQWFRRPRSSARKKLGVSIVLLLFISASLALPVASSYRWNSTKYLSGEEVEVPNQIFNDATYMRWQTRELPTISNDYVLAAELSALTGNTFLGSSLQMVLSGDITFEDIQRNVTWSDSHFPRNLYVWFGYPHQEVAGQNIMSLMILGMVFVGAPYHGADYFSSHPKVAVIVANQWPTKFVDQYSINKANLLPELQNAVSLKGDPIDSFCMYKSDRISVYALQLIH